MVTARELEHLISPALFSTFIKIAEGDERLAVDLYEWTGEIAGSLHRLPHT